MGLRMDTLPSSDCPVYNKNIDSTVCACQSESVAHSGASSYALSLRVLYTPALGGRASAAVAHWPFSPSSAFSLPKYAYHGSLYTSKCDGPFIPGYENWRHLRAGAQFDATGQGNPYTLLDG